MIGRLVKPLVRASRWMSRICLVTSVQRGCKLLMDVHGIVSGNQKRRVTVAAEEADQFVFRNAGVDSGAGYFVSVQMQDRKHGAVAHGVEKLVAFPAAFQRTGFGFSVSDDAGNHQIRIVECGAISVQQCITQLAAFVNRSTIRELNEGVNK